MSGKKINSYANGVSLQNQDLFYGLRYPYTSGNDITLSGLQLKSSINQVYDVKNYGAIGNGITDDRISIQSAISAAISAGGGVIYFPPGIYLVSDDGTNQSIIPGSNITLRGESPFTSIIKLADNSPAHVIQLQNINNIIIEDLQIHGNRDNNDPLIHTHGIRIANCDTVFINRVIIHDTVYYGIGAQTGTLTRIWITNCEIYDAGADGIDFKNKNDNNYGLVIDNLSIKNIGLNGDVDNQTGIDIRGLALINNVSVTDLPDGAYGIRFREGETYSVNGFGGHGSSLTGFRVEGVQSAAGCGVYVGCRDVHVSNGYIVGMFRGMTFLGPRNTAKGVTAINSVDAGFSLTDATASADVPDAPDDIILLACHALWDAPAGASTRGFRLSQSGAAIRERLISCTAQYADIGVYVNAGSIEAIIDGGDFSTCTTPILDAGTDTIIIKYVKGAIGVPKVIGGTDNSSALTLQSTSSATPSSDYIRVVVGGVEAGRFAAGGQLVMNHTTPINTGISGRIQVHGTTSAAGMGASRWDVSSAGPSFMLAKSRGGSAGTNGIVSNGDTAGTYDFSADDGATFRILARIAGIVDGTASSNDMPGRIVFYTSTDGETALTERMRINNAGNIGIGGASFGNGTLVAFIANATVPPTSNPVGGGILYVESGALKYRGSSGTITTLGIA